MSEDKILDISWGTILKITFALFCFYLIYLIKDILIWIAFALIISILFDPAIDFLKRRKIPRTLATIFVYVFLFGLMGTLIYSIVPFFIFEIEQFTQLFSQYFDKIAPPLSGLGVEAFESMESFTGALEGWLISASANIFSALASIFGGIFSAVTIFTIAVFLSIEEKGIEKVIRLLSPKKHEEFILSLWEKSKVKVSRWFASRILLCVFIGVFTFVACYILNIKYAVSFGLLAGVSDIIPIIGPIFAGAIIVMFCALESWVKALIMLVIFLLIQQIEGTILTPILTKRLIGLPPVLVIIALMIGGRLWGVLGAVLAIPLFGLLYEFSSHFLKRRKEIQAEM